MIPHTEAERPALLNMQKLRMDQCWRKGEIGSITYLRILMQQGYAPRDAQTELSLLRMEERRPDADLARMERSREWMRGR
jgi:hypothetical protein